MLGRTKTKTSLAHCSGERNDEERTYCHVSVVQLIFKYKIVKSWNEMQR